MFLGPPLLCALLVEVMDFSNVMVNLSFGFTQLPYHIQKYNPRKFSHFKASAARKNE